MYSRCYSRTELLAALEKSFNVSKTKEWFLKFVFVFCYCSWLIPSLVCEIPLLRCLFPVQFKISLLWIFHVFDLILMLESNKKFSNFHSIRMKKMTQNRNCAMKIGNFCLLFSTKELVSQLTNNNFFEKKIKRNAKQ